MLSIYLKYEPKAMDSLDLQKGEAQESRQLSLLPPLVLGDRLLLVLVDQGV